jgi:sec-independent protein translocase protein TatC
MSSDEPKSPEERGSETAPEAPTSAKPDGSGGAASNGADGGGALVADEDAAETGTPAVEIAGEPVGGADDSESSSLKPTYYDDPYDDYGYDQPRSAGEEAGSTTAVEEPKPEPAAAAVPPPGPPPGDEEDQSGGEDEEGMVRMSFLEHLEELRTRILQSLYGLGIAYLLSLIFAKELLGVVIVPIERALIEITTRDNWVPPLQLVAITSMEQFHMMYIKVPILAGIFLASPWLLYQVWAFVAPGLYKRERRWAKPFIFSTSGLFVLGGVFGYFVVLRFALSFLLGIGEGIGELGIRPTITLASYFDTFVSIELGLGIVFQMPVLIFFFTLLRVVNPRFLLEHIRYAILGIFMLAAVITPTPDVFNMLLFAGPMILLFFVGIGASYILVYHREGKKIPWFRIVLISLLILGTIIGGTIYYLQLQHGFRFVPDFPWFVR